jgi:hypothetical protein
MPFRPTPPNAATPASAASEPLRDIYARKALEQVPRLLSLEDRDPFSPTFGCANREYWLCRSTDFPSSIAQFGIHALALAWAHEMPGNIYYQHPKILSWTLAGIDYWIKIQNRDGSFDEFYPNERGWAGPTGFLLYAMCDSFHRLDAAFPEAMRPRFFEAVEKAGRYLARWDEPGVLANHHAMAVLPVFEAARLLGSRELWDGYQAKLDAFYSYCDPEGWCLEYDGADPGYLSATVSFLGKIYKHRKQYPVVERDKKMRQVMERAVEFCSYFAYPNGHYAGTTGSRQTLHFYPHGFELLAPEIPLAGAVADAMLRGLEGGALVPPAIQEDRYFQYRVPEFLLSYLDYGWRTYAGEEDRPKLPFERAPFERFFSAGKIFAKKTPRRYLAINLAKGGVVKQFDLETNKLLVNDCGFYAQLEDGRRVTTQWIDPSNQVAVAPPTLEVSGPAHLLPAKLFTPVKFILFRVFILAIGWNAWLAYQAKGLIRKLLMTRAARAPARCHRTITLAGDDLVIRDVIEMDPGARVRRFLIGDELPLRYVPQSRYFQPQELDVEGWLAPDEAVARLNRQGRLTVTRTLRDGQARVEFQ